MPARFPIDSGVSPDSLAAISRTPLSRMALTRRSSDSIAASAPVSMR
ncbi:Uncharacterised protein [Mycobacteroides abscessus subsp. abscessus]|nr:Uncharacterised protein [Mycobacteroides abscessus subsp. abscessus]